MIGLKDLVDLRGHELLHVIISREGVDDVETQILDRKEGFQGECDRLADLRARLHYDLRIPVSEDVEEEGMVVKVQRLSLLRDYAALGDPLKDREVLFLFLLMNGCWHSFE